MKQFIPFVLIVIFVTTGFPTIMKDFKIWKKTVAMKMARNLVYYAQLLRDQSTVDESLTCYTRGA